MLIPNRMFRNHDGKYFDEVTTTGNFGHLQKGHGIAFGDINNNGQQDVFLVTGGAFEGDTAHDCLFVNPGNKNHWVTLAADRRQVQPDRAGSRDLRHGGHATGRPANLSDGEHRRQFRQQSLAAGDRLGDATGIKQVTIHWPASGVVQTFTNLNMDCFYKIREGDARAKRWNVPTFKLRAGQRLAKAS